MTHDFPVLAEMSDQPPRVLNLHLGQPNQDHLAAVNIQLEPGETSTITASFANGHFVIVRSAGVTDGLPANEVLVLFKEWKRILHRFGLLYLNIPADQTATLTTLLRKAGFVTVRSLPRGKDLPGLCGYSELDDSRLTLYAGRKKLPHSYKPKLSDKLFSRLVMKFRETATNPASSFIIPVHNEEASLPGFLKSLRSCANMTDTRREFIFVVNGCTDSSEYIIRDFIKGSGLDCRIINSPKGILAAFLTGIKNRKFDGFIGKLDADLILDSQALDLMQMHLVNNPRVMAAYAEPVPRGQANRYNIIEFQPATISRRLFFIGQTCLLRSVPFDRPAVARMLPKLHIEDMFLSVYFTYFYGLDSVEQTPHAITYVKPFDDMDGLALSISRLYSEMVRVRALYPPFATLIKILSRDLYSPEFQRLYEQARRRSYPVKEWARIESSKG